MSRDRYRKGTAIVWVALLGFVLLGFVGLSLDWGKAGLNVHELHNAADAGALAGAQVVKFDQLQAREMAIAIAAENKTDRRSVSVLDNPYNFVDGEVVLGRWIRQRREFIPTTDAPNAVKVVGNRLGDRLEAPPLRLNWGPIFNTDTVAVSRHAIAQNEGSVGAGLLTLFERPELVDNTTHGKGIDTGSDVTIIVDGGDIQDNSQSITSPWEAFRGGTNLVIDCCDLNICGEVYPALDHPYWKTVDFSVNPNLRVPLPDPLVEVPDLWSTAAQGTRPPDVSLPPPPDTAYPGAIAMETHDYGLYGIAVQTLAGVPVLDSNGKYVSRGFNASLAQPITGATISMYGEVVGGTPTITLAPGYYPGGFKLTNGNKIKLLAGVYAFGGGDGTSGDVGVVMEGGTLEGLGVMLYITQSTVAAGSHWGHFSITGGEINLTEALDYANPDAEPYPGYMDTNFKYIAIFQDRANPNAASMEGNIIFTQLKGTLYFPTAHMKFSGVGIEAGTQLIAGSISTSGKTSLHINYDGRFFVGGNRSILVE